MTDVILDWQTITAKLALMKRLLATLHTIGADMGWWTDPRPTVGDDVEDDVEMATDRVKALAVERVLTQVVDLAAGINRQVTVVELGEVTDDTRTSFRLVAEAGAISADLAVKLGPSVGVRNMLMHQFDIEPKQLVPAAAQLVEQYGEYVRQVAAYVQNKSGGR